MLHQSSSTRNDYERKINCDWPKVNILKGCSSGLTQLTQEILPNLLCLSFVLGIIYVNVIRLYLWLSKK